MTIVKVVCLLDKIDDILILRTEGPEFEISRVLV